MTTTEKPASGGGEAAVVAGRGALFIGFAKVYFMITGSGQQWLLHRILTAADYGAFGTVNSLISMVNNTVVQATIQSISKPTAEDASRADAVKRTGLRVQMILGAVIALTFFLGAPALAWFENAPGYAAYFRIAAAIPLLYALYALFVGSANGLRRFRTQAGFDVSFSTIKTVLLVGLAFLWQVPGAFVGFAIAALIILVVAAKVMGLPRPVPPAQAFPVRQLASYVGAIVAYTALLNVQLNFDQPLLQRLAGSTHGTLASVVAGQYSVLRLVALLPYQALLVVTFVIFPLVSRATFTQDREATRTYVTQTLRYALILAAGMGLALAARPTALMAIFKPEYRVGAPALPILVLGECCLGLMSVACAILNAAGKTRATLVMMAATVAISVGTATVLVPGAATGSPILVAAALATTIGAALGFGAALVYVRRTLGGAPPLATLLRVGAASAAVIAVARMVPVGTGKFLGALIIGALVVIYLGVLIVTGEFGPDDRAKFARILRRR